MTDGKLFFWATAGVVTLWLFGALAAYVLEDRQHREPSSETQREADRWFAGGGR